MTRYTLHTRTRDSATPQSTPIPGRAMAPNSAGGFAFAVDDWTRLDRFLVLGAEGGSYYAGERTLVRENAAAVERCLASDGARAVTRIVEISVSGRAPKQEPAIFALALAAAAPDERTRAAALAALPAVCRTGTHLFLFAEAVTGFRGWGRGLRRAVASWYTVQPIERLALQATKYQARAGWSHRDLLRLAHPVTDELARRALFDWIVNPDEIRAQDAARSAFPAVDAALRLRGASVAEAVRLVREHRLVREVVPTELLGEAEMWEALLADMPLHALLRSLAKLTETDLVRPRSGAARFVADRLGDRASLRAARVHPLAVLLAAATYRRGQGLRGRLAWTPVMEVMEALDDAFHLAFDGVEPTGRRVLVALDVSGSMSTGAVAGVPLTPREAAAAMALVTVRTEARHQVVAFAAGGNGGGWLTRLRGAPAGVSGILPFEVRPGERLARVVERTAKLPFGGTDCALPMLYALDRGLAADVFVVLTDSETWAGAVHPAEALERYRRETGIAAKLVVVGMVSNGFSIADPNDAGMLDVVGFDAAAPALIADFARA
jgi:60 kDa SS-A/Ro ribonucleoprotein